MNSKYLAKIKAITDSGLLSLNGNRILIELLEEGEKVTKGGIVLNATPTKLHSAADRARVAVVLAVGPGYTAEDTGEHVDLDYKPGDYLLVNQFGVKTFGEFFNLSEYKPDSVGLITDDLIQGKVANFEKFNEALKG